MPEHSPTPRVSGRVSQSRVGGGAVRTREAMQRAQQSSEPTTIPITIGSPKPQPRSLVLVGTADSVYGSSHSVHGSQLTNAIFADAKMGAGG